MKVKGNGGELRNWIIENEVLRGNIFGDERFDMNERIHTTVIQKITVETNNTIYTLAVEDKK